MDFAIRDRFASVGVASMTCNVGIASIALRSVLDSSRLVALALDVIVEYPEEEGLWAQRGSGAPCDGGRYYRGS